MGTIAGAKRLRVRPQQEVIGDLLTLAVGTLAWFLSLASIAILI